MQRGFKASYFLVHNPKQAKLRRIAKTQNYYIRKYPSDRGKQISNLATY